MSGFEAYSKRDPLPQEEKLQESVDVDPSLPTAATESVLAEVERAHRAHGAGHAHNQDEIAHLHDSIHSCECGKLFDEYVDGIVPTFDRMFKPLSERIQQATEVLQTDAEKYGPNDVAEEMRALTLLKGREQQVQTAVQLYVQSVIRFNTLKQLSHGGAHDDKENFVRADQSRRRLHNGLIDSLRVYLDAAQKANELGLLSHSEPAFAQWDIGIDARTVPDSRALLFSGKTLERREFVRDWAIAAFFAERLQELETEGTNAS